MMLIYWAKICIIKKTEAVLMAAKEIGLEINTEQTKYWFMSRNKIYDKVTTER